MIKICILAGAADSRHSYQRQYMASRRELPYYMPLIQLATFIGRHFTAFCAVSRRDIGHSIAGQMMTAA